MNGEKSKFKKYEIEILLQFHFSFSPSWKSITTQHSGAICWVMRIKIYSQNFLDIFQKWSSCVQVPKYVNPSKKLKSKIFYKSNAFLCI